MALFLVVAVPGAYLLVLSIERVSIEGNVRPILFFLRMMALSLVVYIAFYFFQRILSFDYTSGSLYLYYLLLDIAIFLVPSFGAYLFFRILSQYRNELGRFIGVFSIFSGIWCIPGILDAVLFFGNYDMYILFVRPVLRITLAVFLSVGLGVYPHSGAVARWCRYSVTVIFPFLIPLVPMWYYLNHYFAAFFACAVFMLATVIFLIVCRKESLLKEPTPHITAADASISNEDDDGDQSDE